MNKKKIIIISLAVLVLVAAKVFGCHLYCRWQESRFNIVKLNGVSVAMNYSHICAPDAYVTESLGHGPVLLLWEGDQFILETPSDQSFFMVYSKKDGTALSFQSNNFLLRQSGKPVSISIESESEKEAWAWLRQATDQELRSLRFLVVDLNETKALEPLDIPALKRVARLNPHIGLAINSPDFMEILPLFKPFLLYLNMAEPLPEKEMRILSEQQGLQVLFITGGASVDAENLKFLSSLTHLRQLSISEGEFKQLPSLPRSLRELFFQTCTIEDISPLASLRQLRELSLYNCTLTDIKPLSRLKNLVFLNLGETELSDMSTLDSLRQLKYIVAPKEISQEALVSLLRAHPDLEMIQLRSPALKNIDPLKQMRRLKALTVTVGKNEVSDFLDASSFYELKNLRYLALSENLIADDAQGQKLQKALPDCQVTLTRNICLGSGWILIFWPVVLAFLGVIKYREKLSK